MLITRIVTALYLQLFSQTFCPKGFLLGQNFYQRSVMISKLTPPIYFFKPLMAYLVAAMLFQKQRLLHGYMPEQLQT